MHARLDYALDKFRMKAAKSGSSREIVVPGDLDLKLQIAALYIFCNMKTEELAKHQSVLRDRTIVYRWLKEILTLLDLR